MKYSKIIFSLALSALVNAQSFCSSTEHSGQSITETDNKTGVVGDVNYELWSNGGNNSATFYDDGSFTCSFEKAFEFYCRSGLSFDGTTTHDKIGQMYADYKVVKKDVTDIDYSLIGVYGTTIKPRLEFFIVDNWFGNRPYWDSLKNHGNFTIGDSTYTIYEYNRSMIPIVDITDIGLVDTGKQFFSIRTEARDCGTIDINAHFNIWRENGMRIVNPQEIKIFTEFGGNDNNNRGTVDFEYAKVYIDKKEKQDGYNNNTTEMAEYCSASSHSGENVTLTNNKIGSINDVSYELWVDGINKSASFYSDGSFTCSFQEVSDGLCRTGLSFDGTKTHSQIGHMYADFKFIKENIENVDYSYVGVYGKSLDSSIEFYIVDNWLTESRPEDDNVGNINHGDFEIDGATYAVYENIARGPTIDMEGVITKQFFSIRKEAHNCGKIDITAHIQQWEKLDMKLGKLQEVKIIGEASSESAFVSGIIDFPYAKVYVEAGIEETDEPVVAVDPPSCSSTILDQGYPCCSDSECVVVYTDEFGDWGVEDGHWCGCGNKVPEPQKPSSCPSSISDQGYPCCSDSECVVVYTDEFGDWSIENNDWCGCIRDGY
ncbi:family 11 glycoside hydrolase [Piromyces sp. E2]|nr:family 11 glycoside hydrolase [Piromyces sp. E2]|eukprot:OUM60013.1 family 11 glycoside hydrolase [Piromyces sp. E2]